MNSAKKNASELPPPLGYRLRKMLIALLKYPRKVALRYNAYNAAVGEMIKEGHLRGLEIYRRRYAKLVNIFIYLPLALGTSAVIASVYAKKLQFSLFWFKLSQPIRSTSFINELGIYFNKISFFVTDFPLKFDDLQYLLYGYIISIIGAYILSLNVAFKKEDQIRDVLISLKHLDQEGYPWKVTWTPEAIMITSFNCDPVRFTKDTKFWSSINFSPSPQPKILSNNTSKFIVQKKYELPLSLIFDYKEMGPEFLADNKSLTQEDISLEEDSDGK